MRTLKNNKLTNILGATSAVALSLLGLFIISPSVTEGASAESAEIPVSIALDHYLRVAFTTEDKGAVMQAEPSIEGTFVRSNPVGIKVETNNPGGYKLAMATGSGANTLVNPDGDAISSIAGDNVASSSFPNNTWGYQMSSSGNIMENYNAIPYQNAVLHNNTGTTDTYSFSFGVKVNATKSGTYSNTVILSAVANPNQLSSLNDVTYMQDMTNSICTNTPIEPAVGSTKQLIDMRDGKYYWVTKLKDNHCWMTQNLDWDIPATVDATVASQSDNIPAGWSPSAATNKTNMFSLAVGDNNSYSWDVGEYMITDSATNTTACANIASGTTPINKDCARLQPYDGSAENAHYLVGNYYQWNAATAGTGNSVTEAGADASGSICPSRWKLPQDANSTGAAGAAYDKLLDTYSVGADVSKLTSEPLYFPRAGIIYSNGYANIGSEGDYWSSTAASNIYTYRLYFVGTSSINTSDNYYRYYGYPIRCVAR